MLHLFVAVMLTAQAAAPSLASDLRRFADEHFAAFGNADAFETFYDHSAEFTDIERGAIKDWPTHRSDIRGFFERAVGLKASWVEAPKIVTLGPDAGVIVGTARFNFTLGGVARENISSVTYVVRRNGGRWAIVHAHGSSPPPKPQTP